MAMRATDPLKVTTQRVSLAETKAAILKTNPDRLNDVTVFLHELYRLCTTYGRDFAIYAAIAVNETDWFTSSWWRNRLNPAGIGITGVPKQDAASPTFANGKEAADCFFLLMEIKISRSIPDSLIQFMPIAPHKIVETLALANLADFPMVRQLEDLHARFGPNDRECVWACNPANADAVIAKASAIWPRLDQSTEGPTMPTYAVAGLATRIELPVPLIQRIIPESQKRQRPGIPRHLPGLWIQHETDNHDTDATAEMHANYLLGGAEGRQASWHFSVDDHFIYQHVPINEVTWQSADGDGPGNMSGVSSELCVYRGIDTAKARHNAEALAGEIMPLINLDINDLKRHWDMNAGSTDRHHCPDEMMSQGYWPVFVANVGKLIAAPEPTPEYTQPARISWKAGDVGRKELNGTPALAFLMEVRVTERDVTPHSDSTEKHATGPDLALGSRQIAIGSYKGGAHRNGFVVLDEGSRIRRTSVRPLVPLPDAK